MARVVIYTKSYCSFCRAAKALLRSKGIDFQETDITDETALQEKVRQLSGQTTVPQIFIDGRPIGGYEELRRLDATRELDRLLGLSK
ncbi:MAG TPA: glutaredoxin 3 [Candidatus Acidoferrales bacterium]|nr:glutaredoxin 3 [Candidatus Acidoferrales bacterium]